VFLDKVAVEERVKGSQQPENKDDCEVGRPTVSPPCILVTSSIFILGLKGVYWSLSVGWFVSRFVDLLADLVG